MISPVRPENSVAPKYPADPPSPATDPQACLGNMSGTSVYRFAEKPWWAAVARPIRNTLVQRLETFAANTTGRIATAQTSIAVLREAFTLKPLLSMIEEMYPPIMLPTVAMP